MEELLLWLVLILSEDTFTTEEEAVEVESCVEVLLEVLLNRLLSIFSLFLDKTVTLGFSGPAELGLNTGSTGTECLSSVVSPQSAGSRDCSPMVL